MRRTLVSAFALCLLASLLSFSMDTWAAPSPVTTLQSAAAATGNGLNLNVTDKGVTGLAVTGTFVGTVTFEASTDGVTTWTSVNCSAVDTLTVSTSTTTTGQFLCSTAGLTAIRARVSAYTSGTITVTAFPASIGGGSGAGGSGVGGSVSTLAGCWATVDSPSYLEGTLNALACTLTGLLRVAVVEFNVLLSCEDQTNSLCMVSGGAVRITTFSSVTSATSSAVTTVPTGSKTFVAQIINATSETKAATVTIYGNVISSTTGGIPLCTITLPSTVTVLQLQDACPVVTANFPFYFYTVTAYTSASSAPFTLYANY